MPASLNHELTGLGLGAGAALVLGLVAGNPLLMLTVFFAGYAVWLLWRMARVVRWLEEGGKTRKAPQTVGIANDMVYHFSISQRGSRKQKNRYKQVTAQFNSLANALPDAIVLLNDDRSIRLANPAANQLLGVDLQRDAGNRIDNLVRNPELRHFLDDGDYSEHRPIEIPAPGNRERTLEIRRVPAARGRQILLARDISREISVRRMRREFVADVSHELRSPLTVILGRVELALDEPELTPASQEAFVQIEAQARRMLDIVRSLLQLARIEGVVINEEDLKTVVLQELVESVIAEADPELRALHPVELAVDATLRIRALPSDLRSAVRNVVHNALQHTPSGTAIQIATRQDSSGWAELLVIDHGNGIEAPHLERLGERFYRIDRARARDSGGTGLGLAITKHALRALGGELRIESPPGEGARFILRFPPETIVDQDEQ